MTNRLVILLDISLTTHFILLLLSITDLLNGVFSLDIPCDDPSLLSADKEMHEINKIK